MSYATPAELRDRYRVGIDQDAFALRDDADLQAALDSASAEIDSWLPQGARSAAALAILRDKCLTLARMLLAQDQALDAAHPIVRDALAVRTWLRAGLPLPTDAADAAAGPQAPQVGAPPEVFGGAFLARFGVR